MAAERFVIIRVNVDTGAVDFPSSPGITLTEDQEAGVASPIKDEIDGIRRGNKRYLRIGEIIQTVESPGCVYWDGVRWVKFC